LNQFVASFANAFRSKNVRSIVKQNLSKQFFSTQYGKKKGVFLQTKCVYVIWAFFTDNGRHAGRLGYFPEYVNRINLRAEMEQGAL